MPSPFPGMDPYLEHPDIFPDLHGSMIFLLKEAIQPLLKPPYFARTNRRVWVEYSERHIEPDVQVLSNPSTRQEKPGMAATAVAPSAGPVVVRVSEVLDDEQRESFLEIYAGQISDKRLVTSVEVLSPANKSSRGKGRDLYLQKQHEMLRSPANLVEIDLLRGGLHTTAVPKEGAVDRGGSFDYHVCVHKFDQPSEYLVYPILLANWLPPIQIPLLPGDAPVEVDLQAILDRCYETGAYERELRYSDDELVPPLTPEQHKWAQGVLKAHAGSSEKRP